MQVRHNDSCDPWPKCHLIQQLMSQLRLCFLVIDDCSCSFWEADLHIKTHVKFLIHWRVMGLFASLLVFFIIFNEFSHDIASTAWAGRISSKNKFHSSMFKARAVFCWAWIEYPTLVLSLLPPPVNRCYSEPLILFCIKQALIMVRQQWMNFNSNTSAYILCLHILLDMLISDIGF